MILEGAPNYWLYDLLTERTILAVINTDVNELNFELQDDISGEIRIYKSSVTTANVDNIVNYSPELLKSLDLPGFPTHNFQFKVWSVVMRNINQPKLWNGKR